MAIGFSSGLRGLPKVAKGKSPAAIAAAQRQGLSLDDLELDQEVWNKDLPNTASGIFSGGVTPKGAPQGALSDVSADALMEPVSGGAPAAPAKASPKGRGFWDNVGLIGATMSDVSAGLRGDQIGNVQNFLDREKSFGQQEEMNSLLEGLDLSPEELGMVKAGEGLQVLAARAGDKRENRIYSRNRADTVADRTQMRGWDVADRDLMRGWETADRAETRGWQVEDREDQQTYGQGQFDKSYDQNDRQFNASLGSAERIAGMKAGSKSAWGPAQLMSAYNKATGFIDEQDKTLADLDQIAAESAAFQNTAKDFGAIGPGMWEGVQRWFGGDKGSELDRHTKSISALMKKPGGGAWTDADQRVAESYAVNAGNSREANEFAMKIANNRAVRQREYVDFLRQNVDENDPASLQNAKMIWAEYAKANPLFDAKGNALDPSAMPIEQWLQSAMQGGGQGASAQGGSPVKVSSPQERDALPPGTQYVAPDGTVKIKR